MRSLLPIRLWRGENLPLKLVSEDIKGNVLLPGPHKDDIEVRRTH